MSVLSLSLSAAERSLADSHLETGITNMTHRDHLCCRVTHQARAVSLSLPCSALLA